MLNGAEGGVWPLDLSGGSLASLNFHSLICVCVESLTGLLGGFNGSEAGAVRGPVSGKDRQVEGYVKSHITHVVCLALSSH